MPSDDSDEMVKRSFYVPAALLDQAQDLADTHLEDRQLSVVTRRAIELGLEQLRRDPTLLLRRRRRGR